MKKVANDRLTAEQQDRLRQRLVEERAVLERRLTERRAELGRWASREPDDGDWASSSADQSLVARLTDRDSKLMVEMDRAVAKFAAGTYGLCELTGEPIGFDRLWLRPWARHAVASKERVERERSAKVADDRLGPSDEDPAYPRDEVA